MSEKHSQLPSTCEDLRSTHPTPDHKVRTRRYLATKIVALSIAVTIFVHTYQPQWHPTFKLSNQPTPSTNDFHPKVHHNTFLGASMKQPTPQYTQCDSTDSVMRFGLAFNITNEFHFLDISRPSQDNVHGLVLVNRGSDDQIADIEVDVSTHYSSSSPPDVQFGELFFSKTFELDYSRVPEDECIEIEAVIRLKPDVNKKLDSLSIKSERLGINMQGSLTWTVDNLSLHAAHGNTVYGASDPEPLVTHNISASSITGEIYGYFVADAHLNMTNDAGNTGVFLIPRMNSDVPATLESITVTSVSGEMIVGTLAEIDLWPMRPFHHTTHIRSETGKIRAGVPHGTLTNITNDKGDMTATLIPFGADPGTETEFHTQTNEGNMYVHVYNTIQESLKDGQVDPLLSLKSRHEVVKGSAKIRYPYSWWGSLEGKVDKGTLEFDGTRMDKVEKGDGWVKAWRGESESFMESWVCEGELDVKIGLGPE